MKCLHHGVSAAFPGATAAEGYCFASRAASVSAAAATCSNPRPFYVSNGSNAAEDLHVACIALVAEVVLHPGRESMTMLRSAQSLS